MGHYTDGRRWSYISNSWILVSSWNDKEEIASLRARVAELESNPQSEVSRTIEFTVEEIAFVMNELAREHHDGSDFEAECPSCTAYAKLKESVDWGERHGTDSAPTDAPGAGKGAAYCGRCDRSPAQAPNCPHGKDCGRPGAGKGE